MKKLIVLVTVALGTYANAQSPSLAQELKKSVTQVGLQNLVVGLTYRLQPIATDYMIQEPAFIGPFSLKNIKTEDGYVGSVSCKVELKSGLTFYDSIAEIAQLPQGFQFTSRFTGEVGEEVPTAPRLELQHDLMTAPVNPSTVTEKVKVEPNCNYPDVNADEGPDCRGSAEFRELKFEIVLTPATRLVTTCTSQLDTKARSSLILTKSLVQRTLQDNIILK